MESLELTENQNQLSEHEAAMVAKAEAANDESLLKDSNEFGEEKQQLLAGKYKTPEDLEKAYKELEAKLGGAKEETPTEETPPPANEAEAKETVEKVGVNFEELNQEFAANGELSADTYSKLEKAGIPKSAVDAYIAGQQAIVEKSVKSLQALAGGEESYNAMIAWAKENLSDIEKQGFNEAIKTDAGSQFAIQGLYARYKAQAEPSLIKGNNGVSANNSGYGSQREMMEDMASHKYKVDPAFRQYVQNKVARSKF